MKADRSAAPQSRNQTPKKTIWAWTVATFFGVGYLGPGSGTWASAVAVLLWAAEAVSGRLSAHTVLIGLFIWIGIAIAFGVPAATIVERESGRHDPGFVVIDEVIGQWIALLFSPVDWRHALVAFVLFRLFDIVKPFPVRRLERLPSGWGIVFDDAAAGLYALGIASLLRIWF